MWIARDKDGKLNIFMSKPIRVINENEECYWSYKRGEEKEVINIPEKYLNLLNVTDLTWEDEPYGVVLTQHYNLWFKDILEYLKEAYDIAEKYSNPFANDCRGSVECENICKTIKPLIDKLTNENSLSDKALNKKDTLNIIESKLAVKQPIDNSKIDEYANNSLKNSDYADYPEDITDAYYWGYKYGFIDSFKLV